MTDKSKVDLADIKLLVMDVDGVLTSGHLIINADGSESKQFNTLDGHGIRLWKRAGLKAAFLSGRFSPPTEIRAKQLEVDYCLQDCHFKVPAIEKLLKKARLTPEQTAYIGDDLPDLPVINFVGFGVAVANAVEIVRSHADFVTKTPGGHGAVREVVEYILKKTDRWDQLMERYLPDGGK
jgi:3-deoxy-D-manno-octulosonate 8-phosphate phosphatase (KDO 8-P phosphatase)